MLVGREREGQIRVKSIDEPTTNSQAGFGHSFAQGCALLQQGRLQDERFSEPQRLTGRFPVSIDLRVMNLDERIGHRNQPALSAKLSRHGVCNLGCHRQDELHHLRNLPRRHRRGGRVERNRRERPLGGVGVGLLIRFEKFVVRMRQLQCPAIRADLASEDTPHAGSQVFLAPRLVEEREGQRARATAIRNAHLENRAFALTHRAGAHIEHLGHNRDVLFKRHIGNRRELTPARVPPRVMTEQVADRVDAKRLLESGGRFAADQARDLGIKSVGHGSSLLTVARSCRSDRQLLDVCLACERLRLRVATANDDYCAKPKKSKRSE